MEFMNKCHAKRMDKDTTLHVHYKGIIKIIATQRRRHNYGAF